MTILAVGPVPPTGPVVRPDGLTRPAPCSSVGPFGLRLRGRSGLVRVGQVGRSSKRALDRRTEKRFGEIQALDGVTFGVRPGEIFGFLGANGAGKTTTMRIVLGFLRADEGQVAWLGRDVREWPRRTWGYMPEERGLYLRMPVLDQLMFFGSLYGLRRSLPSAALDWLARFRIADIADRRLESLSKGNQQKVQFIATVLHGPDVILMDEPFSGLDPVNVALLKAALVELRDRGKTIVFSTHQLEMAEELCESVAIIDHGPSSPRARPAR